MNLTAIAANVYKTMLPCCIQHEVEKIRTAFEEISDQPLILIISRIIDGIRAMNFGATLLLMDFSKALDSKLRIKMEKKNEQRVFLRKLLALQQCFTKNT